MGPLVFIDGNMDQELYVVDVLLQYYILWVLDLYKTRIRRLPIRKIMLPAIQVHMKSGEKRDRIQWMLRKNGQQPKVLISTHPIEHVWSELASKLHRRKHLIHNTEDLWREPLLAWENFLMLSSLPN